MTFKEIIETIGCPYRYMDEYARKFPEKPEIIKEIKRVSEECCHSCGYDGASCKECWEIAWGLNIGEGDERKHAGYTGKPLKD